MPRPDANPARAPTPRAYQSALNADWYHTSRRWIRLYACHDTRYRITEVAPTAPFSGSQALVQPVTASVFEPVIVTSTCPGPLRCTMETGVAARMIWQSIGPSTDSPLRRAPSFARLASVRHSTAPGSSRGQASG